MDAHGLVIDRYRTRLDLVGLREDGAGLARDVTRIVRDVLPPLCARELGSLVAGQAGVVRIDRVRLALDVRRDGLAAASLAERLAQQLARRIADVLAGIARVEPGVAVWPDHASFAAAYVAHRLGLLAAPDWAFPDFRPLAYLAPAEAAVELLVTRPAILPPLAGLIADRGGAARLASALPEPAAADLVDRLAATAPGFKAAEEMETLAAMLQTLSRDPAASPGRAALATVLAAILSRVPDPTAVPPLFAVARLAVAVDAVARAVSFDLGRAVEAGDLAPSGLLHLPAPVRDLALAWLGTAATDAATRARVVAAVRASATPVSSRRNTDPPGHVTDGPESTGSVRVISSRIAGLGLLLPAAQAHGLPETLSPVALHRVLVAALAEEDRGAARLDPLPATLAPFDPRELEPAFPPVPDSLRAAVPEAVRPGLASVEGAAGWAGCLIHAFAAMLEGFEASTPGYVRSQFLARPGQLVVAPDRMTLLLAPMPLGVLLHHAGLHGWTGRLAHAGNVPLRIEIEDG